MDDAIRADLNTIEDALRRIETEYFGGRTDPKFLVLLEDGEEFINKLRKFLEDYKCAGHDTKDLFQLDD